MKSCKVHFILTDRLKENQRITKWYLSTYSTSQNWLIKSQGMCSRSCVQSLSLINVQRKTMQVRLASYFQFAFWLQISLLSISSITIQVNGKLWQLVLVSVEEDNTTFFYLPSAVFIAQMLVGPSIQLKQIIQTEHNIVENPNWPKATQLAFYKHGRGLNFGYQETNPGKGQSGTQTRDCRIASLTRWTHSHTASIVAGIILELITAAIL